MMNGDDADNGGSGDDLMVNPFASSAPGVMEDDDDDGGDDGGAFATDLVVGGGGGGRDILAVNVDVDVDDNDDDDELNGTMEDLSLSSPLAAATGGGGGDAAAAAPPSSSSLEASPPRPTMDPPPPPPSNPTPQQPAADVLLPHQGQVQPQPPRPAVPVPVSVPPASSSSTSQQGGEGGASTKKKKKKKDGTLARSLLASLTGEEEFGMVIADADGGGGTTPPPPTAADTTPTVVDDDVDLFGDGRRGTSVKSRRSGTGGGGGGGDLFGPDGDDDLFASSSSEDEQAARPSPVMQHHQQHMQTNGSVVQEQEGGGGQTIVEASSAAVLDPLQQLQQQQQQQHRVVMNDPLQQPQQQQSQQQPNPMSMSAPALPTTNFYRPHDERLLAFVSGTKGGGNDAGVGLAPPAENGGGGATTTTTAAAAAGLPPSSLQQQQHQRRQQQQTHRPVMMPHVSTAPAAVRGGAGGGGGTTTVGHQHHPQQQQQQHPPQQQQQQQQSLHYHPQHPHHPHAPHAAAHHTYLSPQTLSVRRKLLSLPLPPYVPLFTSVAVGSNPQFVSKGGDSLFNPLTGNSYWIYTVTSTEGGSGGSGNGVMDDDEDGIGGGNGNNKTRTLQRRFRHFVALEDRLRECCKGVILPPRPSKEKTRALEEGQARQSATFAAQRARDLDTYLRALVAHPIAGSSEPLKFFLTFFDDLGTAWPEVSTSALTRLATVGAKIGGGGGGGSGADTGGGGLDHDSAMSGLAGLGGGVGGGPPGNGGAGGPADNLIEESGDIIALYSFEHARMKYVNHAMPKLESYLSLLKSYQEKLGAAGMELAKFSKDVVSQDRPMSQSVDLLSTTMLRSSRRVKRLSVEAGAAMEPFLNEIRVNRMERGAFQDRRDAYLKFHSARHRAESKAQKLAMYRQNGVSVQMYKFEAESAYADAQAKETAKAAEEVGSVLLGEVARMHHLRQREWLTAMKIVASNMKEAHAEQRAMWEECGAVFQASFPE